MKTTSKLAELQLSEISVGKNNPRKTFDQESIKELADSIAQKGVLQPILVRPKGKRYELVCGERRYRASKIAKIESIPANIRELDDDEAFEMQIIENLERKDVHPLEEAEAFKRMLDSGRYTQADIAAKMAKPESYIAQRLKLVELIPEIKKDFFSGELGIGQAVDLARIPQNSQKELYESLHSGWNPGYGTQESLRKRIDNSFYELDDAVFDTADETLVPKAGACHNCPKRSGANPVLFPDFENKNTCTDKACYNSKMEAHLVKNVQDIVEGKDALIGRSFYEVPEFIENLIKPYKIPVYKEWDDFRTSDAKNAKLIFMVSGSDAGKFVKGKLLSEKKKAAAFSEEELREQEISKIEDRAARALELDNVKIFKAIKDNQDVYENYINKEEPLTELEQRAMWFLFVDNVLEWNSGSLDKYKKLTGYPDQYNGLANYEFFATKDFEELKLNQLVRFGIRDRLSNMNEPNFESCKKSKFFFEIIKELYPEAVKNHQAEQTEIANKRIVRTEEKLANLKKDLTTKK